LFFGIAFKFNMMVCFAVILNQNFLSCFIFTNIIADIASRKRLKKFRQCCSP
jgi:hypothetical protein